MKAALLRMFGEGDSDMWWNRLLGFNRTFLEGISISLFASPGGTASMGRTSSLAASVPDLSSAVAMVRRCCVGYLGRFRKPGCSCLDLHFRWRELLRAADFELAAESPLKLCKHLLQV